MYQALFRLHTVTCCLVKCIIYNSIMFSINTILYFITFIIGKRSQFNFEF